MSDEESELRAKMTVLEADGRERRVSEDDRLGICPKEVTLKWNRQKGYSTTWTTGRKWMDGKLGTDQS